MKKTTYTCLGIAAALCLLHFPKTIAQTAPNAAQNKPLTVEQIMQKPALQIGTSPSNVFWSEDSKQVYFYWNPKAEPENKLYSADSQGNNVKELSPEQRKQAELLRYGTYNANYTKKLLNRNGDIALYDLATTNLQWLTFTVENESSPSFLATETKIAYQKSDNYFVLNLQNNSLTQLTNFKTGAAPSGDKKLSEAEQYLEKQQLELFQIVKDRKENQDRRKVRQEADKPKYPKPIYLNDRYIDDMTISHDASFVTFRTSKDTKNKQTAVHNYVNASGYAENLNTRPKVGTEDISYEFGVYNVLKDTVLYVNFDKLEGINTAPEFYKEYQKDTKKFSRKVIPHGAYWSADSKYAVLIIRGFDNKDRWIVKLNPEDGTYTQLYHEHNEAWIGGPGTEGWVSFAGEAGFMPDNQHFWFFSEETGYSHLYKVNVATGIKTAITQGNFEIREAWISRDKKFWYYNSAEIHPGEDHYYQLPINGGKTMKINTLGGGNEIFIAPNEKNIAVLHSETNKPWELFVQSLPAKGAAKQVTFSTTEVFNSYAWRIPEVISFKASDGQEVYARVYPANPNTIQKNDKGEPQKTPAVIFVHGAGYLQNAHKRWSTYFREYMFHNLLADKGYTVLDIDYRGSQGYGRDFRTGIYRHMGGKDLSDHVDGAKMLVEKYNVDASKIGIYGGSYGGFITLMAMFTTPDVFKSGAALRSVTDWAHYNHPYTANILNTPATDSLAYRKSSPIYFAEGLKGNLLICHGVVDTNVHFQDVVRLSQRLIELGKDNWEMALYPIEDHGFTEPASWTDEYKRILKLFESTLK